MLPGMDGLTVCQRLRAASDVPILILTAKDAVPDRVKGLDAGADDYVVKPFAFDELLARIRALLRRRQPAAAEEALRFADLTLNPDTHEVYRGTRRVELTAREFELLHLFLQHPAAGDHPRHALRSHLGLRLRRRVEHHRGLHPLPALASWRKAASRA